MQHRVLTCAVMLGCIGAICFYGCAGDNAFRLPFTAAPGRSGPVAGQAVVQYYMPVPTNVRFAIVQSRAAIQSAGPTHTVAPDGSVVTWPTAPASGYVVRVGSVQTETDNQGNFTLNLPPGSPATGAIFFPGYLTTPLATFSTASLSAPGGSSTPILVRFEYDGPCGMSAGDPAGWCAAASRAVCCGGSSGRHASRNVTPAYTVKGFGSDPGATYPNRTEDSCQILDGSVQNFPGSFGQLMKYWGSTCDTRVQSGSCPNENSPVNRALEAVGLTTTISCYRNHKGRYCQEVKPGDLAVDTAGKTSFVALPGRSGRQIVPIVDLPRRNQITVSVPVGASTNVVVHNNGSTGETMVTKTVDQLHGTLTGPGFDGTTIQHYDRALLNAWRDNDRVNPNIYIPDRTLVYTLPAGSAAAGSTDTFEFMSDGTILTVNFTAATGKTITVPANPLWTDTGIKLNPGDSVKLSNGAGSWMWGCCTPNGPDGSSAPQFSYDTWVSGALHGALIGFLGPVGSNPGSAPQDDPHLFKVGTATVTQTAPAGGPSELWLGINDDRVSGGAGDNGGSVTVDVEVTPASNSNRAENSIRLRITKEPGAPASITRIS